MPHTASRGPGRPPAAKAAETRERIMRAAREVFSELGYDAATFQAIAIRADLTRPAINHYFASKRLLYQEVVDQTNASVIESAVHQSQRESTLAGKIRVFIEAAVHAQGQDRSVAAFLVTSVLESERHPELAESNHDSREFTRGYVKAAIKDAVESGEVRPDVDIEAAAEMLMAVMWGLGFYAGFVGDQDRLTAITDQFLQLLDGQAWRAVH
ncbi:TetR/AcrR family transcriptional regulator [Mycobacterium crocinum]|uniref:TetR/AcrR family transcriptional regulator n=2 Tax=Mycolicibacterium TaxID=1866885 RepID=A0ABX8VN52_9MYCO|nr:MULTISPECIES: TetR/AcrR family transcriptional regulator [Mycolicibacterium]APE17310.1 TetR family transcriptional regulator [Mycobacterium sp. WY10]MCV7216475.1 TetR/AcrR family transcriptional regulator [Mycolicibacterium crocinum]QYL17195.1 TetR/AcrR family transcriptional regulator [Mycolicibacterium pallens]ULN41852.1 TetR/AcrR family transcriptional regulator [Mycolicibacterium crocinum]